MCWARRAILAGLCLLLAACQPFPQPFIPDEKSPLLQPLAAPIGDQSIFLPPVRGAPEPANRLLVERLAQLLQDREIVASASTRSAGSAILQTAVIDEGNGQLGFVWRLDRSRRPGLEGVPYPLGLNAEQLAAADPRQIGSIAERLAERIARSIEAADQAMTQAGTAGRPRIALLPFEGAPGDGNQALRRALEQRISQDGAMILVADPAEADYLVACRVRLSDAGPRTQGVAVDWTLADREGTRLGNVSQTNQVPRGSLDGAWGAVALAVAQGGWDGLSQALSRVLAK